MISVVLFEWRELAALRGLKRTTKPRTNSAFSPKCKKAGFKRYRLRILAVPLKKNNGTIDGAVTKK